MWSIGKGILWILDGFFGVINKIWKYEFFNNEYVNKIFSGALIIAGSWLILKVLIELIMNFIVKNDGRSNPVSVYKGIVLAIVMMYLISPLFTFGHHFSTSLTNDIISVSGLSESQNAEAKISKAIIRSMVYTNETSEENIEYLVENWKKIDINDTDGGGLTIFKETYKYSLNFFMLIILAIVTVFLLFFVAIQMAKRVMDIALYKIIGPFCCTSLTSNGKAFEIWSKNTLSLFLITSVQFIGIGLMLAMFGSAFQDNGNLTGLFLVIGALLFVISTPTIISGLLGQQSGIMSAMGDIQSMMALGHASSQGLGIAKAGLMGPLSLGAKVTGLSNRAIRGGVGKISNMLNRGKILDEGQAEVIKNNLDYHNVYKANRNMNKISKENGYNMRNMPNINQFQRTHNLRYNTFTNQYDSNILKNKSNIGVDKK